ncbi:hypothetical protein [Burkholderia sp. Nafp2/4-1b]|uniref:hypothetical protein n=1 Tax=Burkholderia sp. Nafp2/4-1b TaxID=2116686 RepID=UPI0013CE906A|nr:hypothetical protein [Burkholderia sp. Nafp2/4-1b]
MANVAGTAREGRGAGAARGFPTGRRASRPSRLRIIHLEHVDILGETAIKSSE